MKYFYILKINRAITAIRESNIKQEHVTSRAASELIRNYFNKDIFTMVPEQIQSVTLKRPDYVLEKFYPSNQVNSWFIPHVFVEIKSLAGQNISKIVDQLHDTVVVAMDDWGNTTNTYSAFMIGVKGTKIAFYAYHNLSTILDDYGIHNYKGFIPLNCEISYDLFCKLNEVHDSKDFLYRSYIAGMDFDTNFQSLSQKGVIGIDNMPFPHIFDLENVHHREDIHKMFVYIAENNPNYIK